MSWGRKQFKEAYNRRREHQKALRDAIEEDRQDYLDVWADMNRDYYADECYPTVDDHAKGKLFTLLHKLKLREAKSILEQIYW